MSKSTPAPSSTPTPAPTPTSGSFKGINLTVPTGAASTSSADLYGLGVWGGQNVNPGDLPFLTDIAATGNATTGDAVMKAFLRASSDQVAAIQHALYMAGYYPKSYTPKWGVIQTEDRSAFGSLITLAGQSGAPVAQMLTNGAAAGAQAGLTAAQQQAQTSAKQTVLPNATDLEALAIKAFQSVLGEKATPKQAAAFAAAYRAEAGAAQRSASGPQITAPQGNPADLVQQAITNPQANPPGMNPTLAHELGTGGNPNAVPPASFGQQIGGLMGLGQQIGVTPGSAAPTVNQLVSPDVAAANYARNTNPKAAAGNDLADTFNTFLSLLNGIGA